MRVGLCNCHHNLKSTPSYICNPRSLERDLERARADHISEIENLTEKQKQVVSETKKKQWVSFPDSATTFPIWSSLKTMKYSNFDFNIESRAHLIDFTDNAHFYFSVLRVRVRGHLLVLLEHRLLQPGLPADPLDQGAQAPVQATHEEERQGLETSRDIRTCILQQDELLKCRALK